MQCTASGSTPRVHAGSTRSPLRRWLAGRTPTSCQLRRQRQRWLRCALTPAVLAAAEGQGAPALLRLLKLQMHTFKTTQPSLAASSVSPSLHYRPTGTKEAARLCCCQPQVLIHSLLCSSLCCRACGAVAVPLLVTALLPYLIFASSFVCKRLPLLQAFGRTGSGAPVLDALAGLANRLLTADASEVDLHTAVCMRLLPVLVGRRSRCLRLVQLHHWQQLAGGALGAVLPDMRHMLGLRQSLGVLASEHGLFGSRPWACARCQCWKLPSKQACAWCTSGSSWQAVPRLQRSRLPQSVPGTLRAYADFQFIMVSSVPPSTECVSLWGIIVPCLDCRCLCPAGSCSDGPERAAAAPAGLVPVRSRRGLPRSGGCAILHHSHHARSGRSVLG